MIGFAHMHCVIHACGVRVRAWACVCVCVPVLTRLLACSAKRPRSAYLFFCNSRREDVAKVFERLSVSLLLCLADPCDSTMLVVRRNSGAYKTMQERTRNMPISVTLLLLTSMLMHRRDCPLEKSRNGSRPCGATLMLTNARRSFVSCASFLVCAASS